MPLQVPSPRTFSVDEVETASYLNSVRDALTFLVNLPIATVYETLSQALTANTAAFVAYDSTAVDTYGGHSNTVNNGRYTAQVPGYYLTGGGSPMAGSSSGTYRKSQIYYNGAAIAYATASVGPSSSGTNAVTPTLSPTLVYLNAGDYLSIWVETDGTSVNVTPNSSNGAYMTVIWAHA